MTRTGILGLGLIAALAASKAVVEAAPQKDDGRGRPDIPEVPLPERITRDKAIFALNKMGGRPEFAREESTVRAYIFQLEDDVRDLNGRVSELSRGED